MPSQQPLPSISDFLLRGKQAIIGTRNFLADDRSGSVYDFLMGTAALAWSREAAADRDKFRAVYFTSAVNDDLTDYVLKRFGIARILDTQGVGTAMLVRSTTGAGAGTIYVGTRIMISDITGGSTFYDVTEDATVGSTQKAAVVGINAEAFGLGTAINNASGQIIDPLWDNSFFATSVSCANGTVFESAEDFRARVQQTLLAQRPGYPALITQVLNNAGASQVILFPSNYQSTDHGVNVAYVGDGGFGSNRALIIACAQAVEAARVLGADLMVLGMSTAQLSIQMSISLWDDPSSFDSNLIEGAVVAGVIQYFNNPANAFAYKLDGIAGAAARVSTAIQEVDITQLSSNGQILPLADATFSSAAWPSTLLRYNPTYNSVQVSLTGPT